MSAAFIIGQTEPISQAFFRKPGLFRRTLQKAGASRLPDSPFQRMVRREVIWQAVPGKYYLDVEAAQAFRKARRERALNALLIVLVITVVLIYFTMKR